MNLAVRPVTLPLWLPIWLVALLLMANLGLLRKAPQDVTVAHALELHQGRSSACQITLERQDRSYATRKADLGFCRHLHRGQPLVLTETLWLDRWVRLADTDGRKLALLSDNEMLLDVAYIAFAIILPLIFTLRRNIRRLSNLYVLLAAEIFGCLYFIKRLMG